MMHILRGLYLEYKVRSYEAKIKACTKARTKLKQKQKKYSKKYEAYVVKRKEL
jgi:hypothetical protein